jgi:hypothetical protein
MPEFNLTPFENKKSQTDIADAMNVLDNTPLNGEERKAWGIIRTFVSRRLDSIKETLKKNNNKVKN